MKNFLRKLCSPVLNIFEKDNDPYDYKPINRKILIFMSFIFSILGSLVIYFSPATSDKGFLIPAIVFLALALVGFIVGFLGNDRAICRIWGSR